MNKRKVNIILKGFAKKPFYATSHSAGADIYTANANDVVLQPMERKLIPTGLFLELPEDAEAQIRPRSGLSLKKGIVAILGTIDADYRGEIGVILVNLSSQDFTINDGDRIAQLVIAKYETAIWEEVENLDETNRGEGGFGSSGVSM